MAGEQAVMENPQKGMDAGLGCDAQNSAIPRIGPYLQVLSPVGPHGGVVANPFPFDGSAQNIDCHIGVFVLDTVVHSSERDKGIAARPGRVGPDVGISFDLWRKDQNSASCHNNCEE